MAPTKWPVPSKMPSSSRPSAAITLLTSLNSVSASHQPGPLHLTRRQDLLEVELAPADLSVYQEPTHPQPQSHDQMGTGINGQVEYRGSRPQTLSGDPGSNR